MDRYLDPLVLAAEYVRAAFPPDAKSALALVRGIDWARHSGLGLALAASLLVAWLGLGWCRRSSGPGASGGSSGKRHKTKRKPPRPRRPLGCWALGAVAALGAALAARWWQLGGSWAEAGRWWQLGSAIYLPLSERCAHHRFTHRGLGRPLKTEVAIKEGALCCYYAGRDYATAEAAAAVAGPRQINTAEGGGVRVAHLPETHPLDACGVAQLAMVRLPPHLTLTLTSDPTPTPTLTLTLTLTYP